MVRIMIKIDMIILIKMMVVVVMMKMEMMMEIVIRKLSLSANFVPVIVLSTEDTKAKKAILPILLSLTRTQYGSYYHFLSKGGRVASSHPNPSES